jgi:hypothetical protein
MKSLVTITMLYIFSACGVSKDIEALKANSLQVNEVVTTLKMWEVAPSKAIYSYWQNEKYRDMWFRLQVTNPDDTLFYRVGLTRRVFFKR